VDEELLVERGQQIITMIHDVIFLYSSHSGDISKITAAVHIRASMKSNVHVNKA